MSSDADWERWGQCDPYFGVLTDPKFRRTNITAEGRSEFLATGSSHVEYVLGICRQRIDPAFEPSRVLDFGCGVGRVLIPFAARAAEAVGLDIAPSMLAEAKRNCEEKGTTNVRLLLSDDVLSTLEGSFDLVHSCIVLQHIEPARGTPIFERLVERIRPGGIGALHVTFAWDVHANTYGQAPPLPPPPKLNPLQRMRTKLAISSQNEVADDLPAAEADPAMEMHYYNLSELMFILQRAGAERVHTEFTDHGGAKGAYLFFQKARAPESQPILSNT